MRPLIRRDAPDVGPRSRDGVTFCAPRRIPLERVISSFLLVAEPPLVFAETFRRIGAPRRHGVTSLPENRCVTLASTHQRGVRRNTTRAGFWKACASSFVGDVRSPAIARCICEGDRVGCDRGEKILDKEKNLAIFVSFLPLGFVHVNRVQSLWKLGGNGNSCFDVSTFKLEIAAIFLCRDSTKFMSNLSPSQTGNLRIPNNLVSTELLSTFPSFLNFYEPHSLPRTHDYVITCA